jgi:cyclomaltodextrinase
MSVPAWIQDAIFYQIFPDRFFNGDPSLDPPNVAAWGSPPDLSHFMGGDLAGITMKLDYLLDLGVNALYLNPIFLSSSSHRYNTYDYFTIDPKLGTMRDFHRLLDAVHQAGMHLILDGVFNHCGRGFFAFNDVLESGDDSPYRDWFHIRKYPLRAYEPGRARNYEAWWGFKSLPKFNTNNPHVREYIFRVARFWVEQGIDGWRLDVPSEIDDDTFWAEFEFHVRSVNPQAYLLGEIWDGDPRWLSPGHFDGLMHYPLRTATISALNGEMTAADFAAALSVLQNRYPFEHTQALFSLLGSHDTERIYTMLQENSQKVRSAFAIQFALPGAPSVYYGDEIGLPGLKDPDCRRAFPWNETEWKTEIRSAVQNLIALRKQSPALRSGEQYFISAADNKPGIAILRRGAGETMLCVVNLSAQNEAFSFDLPGSAQLPAWTGDDLTGQRIPAKIEMNRFDVTLSAWQSAYFKVNH